MSHGASQEPSQDQDLRPERTTLAGDRTMLANDRTLAAWWRTAMAAVAAAIAFVRLYHDAEPQWLIRGGASLLVVLALVILAIAFRRYRRTSRKIEHDHIDRVPTGALTLTTALLAFAALVAGAVIWLL